MPRFEQLTEAERNHILEVQMVDEINDGPLTYTETLVAKLLRIHDAQTKYIEQLQGEIMELAGACADLQAEIENPTDPLDLVLLALAES